jgi:hypothetical protein
MEYDNDDLLEDQRPRQYAYRAAHAALDDDHPARDGRTSLEEGSSTEGKNFDPEGGALMVRTVQAWKEILASLPHHDAAKRILGDVTHYREGGAHEKSDHAQLANALEAWHELRSGVEEDFIDRAIKKHPEV